MERILPMNETDELIAAIIAVYSIPRIIVRVDALVVFPGFGENQRILEAIYWWQEQTISARFLFIAGHNTKEKSSEIINMNRLKQSPFCLRRLKKVYYKIHATQTKAQSEWTTKKVQKLKITSIALFVSPYHLIRAFLTLLKSFKQHGICIPIIPIPVSTGLDALSPEFEVEMWKMIPGEVKRIQEYQLKGDISDISGLKRYLNWLWAQNIFVFP